MKETTPSSQTVLGEGKEGRPDWGQTVHRPPTSPRQKDSLH